MLVVTTLFLRVNEVECMKQKSGRSNNAGEPISVEVLLPVQMPGGGGGEEKTAPNIVIK